MLATLPFFESISTILIFKPKMSEMSLDLRLKHDKILDDLKTLEKFPVFPEFTTEKNAEWALAQKITWNGENYPMYDTAETLQVRKVWRTYGLWRTDEATFKNFINDSHLMSINTDWLERLNKYDHWNFSTHRQLSTPLALIPKVNSMTRVEIFSQLPIPNYSDLRNWALLNFIKKVQENKAIEGLKTHRKMAQLIHSSGTLIGNVTAAAMLKDEYFLMSRFSIKNWEPKPLYSIDAYTRTSWVWIGLLKASFFNNLPDDFLPYAKPQNGVCASVREASANFTMYLDFFAGRTFFESDFRENVTASTKLFHQLNSDCNHSNYKSFLTRSPASTQPWTWSSLDMNADLFKNYSSTEFNFTIDDNWIYLPYVRRFVGLTFFLNGNSINYSAHYDSVKKPFKGINYSAVF
jgi:hypothetical protein